MRVIFITTLLLLCNIKSNGQLYKYLDIEVAVNHSLVVNKSSFQTSTYGTGWGGGTDSIQHENSAIISNYNFSLGINLYRNHSLRITYGTNNTLAKISGIKEIYDVVTRSSDEYKMIPNILSTNYWGIGYEFLYKIKTDRLLLFFQINRQQSDSADIIFGFSRIGDANYSGVISAGYQKSIYKGLSAIGRIFINNSFRSQKHFNEDFISEFIPIQYGIEIALRYDFYKKKASTK